MCVMDGQVFLGARVKDGLFARCFCGWDGGMVQCEMGRVAVGVLTFGFSFGLLFV